MVNAILGKKIDQSQKFLEDGTRIPVTRIWAGENYVVRLMDKRTQLGFDTKKRISKAAAGILKKAGVTKNLRFFREVVTTESTEGTEALKPGTSIVVSSVLKPGDLVQVMGISKGKGFAGAVKLHHFKGGPRTHGQSDRERAPGSIGQTTTPGRVYRGKRMAARMGTDRVTVKNLIVLDVVDDLLTIKGLVPGGRNSLLTITKIGEHKKFVPLYREVVEETRETKGTQSTGSGQAEETKEEVKMEEKPSGEVKEPASAKASADEGGKDAS